MNHRNESGRIFRWLAPLLAVWGAVGGFCLSLLAMVEEQE